MSKCFSAQDAPVVCEWSKQNDKAPSVHRHNPSTKEPLILDSILDHIGNTPLVRLARIAKAEGIECDLCMYLADALSFQHRFIHVRGNLHSGKM